LHTAEYFGKKRVILQIVNNKENDDKEKIYTDNYDLIA
jgi:hypothetical protein